MSFSVLVEICERGVAMELPELELRRRLEAIVATADEKDHVRLTAFYEGWLDAHRFYNEIQSKYGRSSINSPFG